MSGGRDQNAAMQRLAQLLFVLAGDPGAPVDADRLLRVADYGAETMEDRRRQLFRDVEQLRAAGWDIRNDAPSGAESRYRLVSGDFRLRVAFAPDEQAELQRVERLAGATPPTVATGPLDLVLHAVARRCLLSFDYRGTRRSVHPHHVHARAAGWYLSAREAGADQAKAFRIDRMDHVGADQPGTAEPQPERPRLSVDPIGWQQDPPVVVQIDTTAEHRQQVTDLLGPASGEAPGEGGAIRLDIPVSNRGAFRARLYELGTRVRLVGPPQIRAEVRAELAAVAGRTR